MTFDLTLQGRMLFFVYTTYGVNCSSNNNYLNRMHAVHYYRSHDDCIMFNNIWKRWLFFFFSLNSSWMFNVCYTILSLTFLGRPYLCFCSSKRVISPCTYFLWSLFTCWGLGFATALFTGIGAPTTDKEKFKWKRKIYKLREKWKCGGFQSCTLHTTRGQLGNKLGRVIAYW